jgi:hypothetical protein
MEGGSELHGDTYGRCSYVWRLGRKDVITHVELREKDDGVRAFVWHRRGVVGSLERGSSEVFYWEFVFFL